MFTLLPGVAYSLTDILLKHSVKSCQKSQFLHEPVVITAQFSVFIFITTQDNTQDGDLGNIGCNRWRHEGWINGEYGLGACIDPNIITIMLPDMINKIYNRSYLHCSFSYEFSGLHWNYQLFRLEQSGWSNRKHETKRKLWFRHGFHCYQITDYTAASNRWNSIKQFILILLHSRQKSFEIHL